MIGCHLDGLDLGFIRQIVMFQEGMGVRLSPVAPTYQAVGDTYCTEFALGTIVVVLAGHGAQLPVRSPGTRPTGVPEQAEIPMATAATAITLMPSRSTLKHDRCRRDQQGGPTIRCCWAGVGGPRILHETTFEGYVEPWANDARTINPGTSLFEIAK